MKTFIDPPIRAVLERAGLADFQSLWALDLPAVDEPNVERGGWSSVSQLTVEDQRFYLKRQTNHLTRSFLAPLGEPTFAREMRNIQRYQQKQIPAVKAAFFAQQSSQGKTHAILLTYALTDWHDLDYYLQQWQHLSAVIQQQIVIACAGLVRTLHKAKQLHGCLYPKHIFLHAKNGYFDACFIDLEKTRGFWFSQKDRVKDLETLFRRAQPVWTSTELTEFLTAYLDGTDDPTQWLAQLAKRQQLKESR